MTSRFIEAMPVVCPPKTGPNTAEGKSHRLKLQWEVQVKNRFSEEKFVPNRVAPSMNVVKTIKRRHERRAWGLADCQRTR